MNRIVIDELKRKGRSVQMTPMNVVQSLMQTQHCV